MRAFNGIVASLGKLRREREAEEALFSFYASALALYGRLEALLLLAHVTRCSRRREACAMARRGASHTCISRTLGISKSTVSRWLWDGPPRVPSWARSALSELDEYPVSDVRDALYDRWARAC